MNGVTFSSDKHITVSQFIDILKRSTLAERRPVDDPARIALMLRHGNVLITAWQDNELVGVSRAVTDFSFCCYLSDLAVDVKFQRMGIGKELIRITHEKAGLHTRLLLLAAPAAETYYPKIGMEHFQHCYTIKPRA